MTVYYCLAETTANGEVTVQGNTATYSATTSASATSSVSFEDAAEIAIAASNAQALVVGRAQVELLLTQYAYVLSDLSITEMINNSLKTTILEKLKGILLDKIADTVDGTNFVLNKNVTIKKGQILQIPFGFYLMVPPQFKLTNYGTIQIGGIKKGVVDLTPAVLAYLDLVADHYNYNNINIGTGANPSNTASYLLVSNDPSYNDLSFVNYGTVNNNKRGYIQLTEVSFQNAANTSQTGTLNNTDPTSEVNYRQRPDDTSEV